MAGYVPPPGTYVTDINYYYSGNASGNAAIGIALRQIGNITIEADVNVDANAYINAPIATWIAPEKVLGAMSASASWCLLAGRTCISASILSRP